MTATARTGMLLIATLVTTGIAAGCKGAGSRNETDTPAASCRRGEQRLAAGDAAGALEAFSRVLASDPANPEAFYGRARAKGALQDRSGALRDYDAAIRAAGGALLRSARPDASGRYSDRARAVAMSRLLVDLHAARGVARDRAGDRDGARRDFEEALSINADQAEASIRKARGLP
jgi:Tfp pilus assembly protein PilF